jgi:hypothetical protein
MRIFCQHANGSEQCCGKGNQHKRLTGSKPGTHDQMVNMLTVRREWAHAFTQATVHNRHHIH